ncbi:hypothetical protein F5148DRAFT_1294653 [Russula earlei]|uniref:Uncharacterized protein n=1 Tax=Russula earlei TaxID=71964 RepID=A0ACC0TRD6_9AGAM|nr:hypothetical protein F5148DRAFT_1294653 [Russula earlei]
MDDIDNPVVLTRDYWALTKLWHAVDALYIWEFVTSLDYEWSVIKGRRPYLWTIWVRIVAEIYSFTRVVTLTAAIVNLVGLDAATPINCQVWAFLNFIFSYLALASSSLLVVLRIIAIWNKNRFVIALAACVWGTNSDLISGISRIRSGWDTEQKQCLVLNVESNKLTIIVLLVTDIILLLTMLVGLFSLRRCGGGKFELSRLLWKQGLIWLLLATAVELMPVLFISLYLNDALNIMFLMPSLLTMSIASTRMYRSLADFSFSTDVVRVLDNMPKSDPSSGSSAVLVTPPNMMDVNMNVAYVSDPYLIFQPARYASFLDMTREPCDPPHGLSFDEDHESGREVNPTATPLLRHEFAMARTNQALSRNI